MDHPWLAAIRDAPISKSTKQQYLRNIQTMCALADGRSLEEVVRNPTAMLHRLEREYSNYQTRKAMIASVKAIFKYVPAAAQKYGAEALAWHACFKTLDKAIMDKTASAQPSERELAGWVTWPHVLEKQRELSKTAYGSTEHLLLSMYCVIEPLRADYGAVAIVESVPKDQGKLNFMVIPRDGVTQAQPLLILNTYKTAGKYGTFQRTLPTELVNIVQRSLQIKPREYLFVDESNEPYTKSNSYIRFTNRTLERLFHKPFTIRLLRHSFISNIDFNESTPAELMAHSRNMLHSMSMQQLYRRKVPTQNFTIHKLPRAPRAPPGPAAAPPPAPPPPPPRAPAPPQNRVFLV